MTFGPSRMKSVSQLTIGNSPDDTLILGTRLRELVLTKFEHEHAMPAGFALNTHTPHTTQYMLLTFARYTRTLPCCISTLVLHTYDFKKRHINDIFISHQPTGR